MSSSSGVSETAFGNKTTTMMPEKSSFSVTCNRLREYLKEKGSFGDVSLGIALAGDNGFGVSSAAGPKSETIPRSLSSMNLFPQPVVEACVEDVAKVDDNKKCAAMEPEKAQMTIFYGGQVMVFNDMHVGKAMEVMRLATIAGSSSSLATGNPVPATAGLGVAAAHESLTKISQPVLRDIPIARKQSLARFLEKRKDRIMSRSPYYINNFTKGVSPSMPDDKSWLGLAGS